MFNPGKGKYEPDYKSIFLAVFSILVILVLSYLILKGG